MLLFSWSSPGADFFRFLSGTFAACKKSAGYVVQQNIGIQHQTEATDGNLKYSS